ncbi:MAG: xanthine dehydrogenase family protein subunit M [Hyphomicrobiaceae bacterium]
MYNFEYEKAKSVDAASARLGQVADSKLLAGGMTLLPTIKLRLAKPSALIDLGTIGDLKGISVSGDTVTIKAMTRHADVTRSAEVAKAIPALAALAGGIGDVQVRHRGTMGGSVANNDPAADYPAGCLGLGATVVTNKRELIADDFFQGLFTTALEPDEIITEIRFPVPEKAAYIKFKNPASRYAIVGAFVSKGPNGVRVAITGAGDNGVFRVKAMEDALSKSFDAKAIEGIKVPADTMLSDIHASAEYRAHLVTVMAKRAVTACG